MIAVLTATLLLVFYFLRINRYRKAFKRSPEYKVVEVPREVFISVVIPYKNEAENIPALLESLKKQEVRSDFEIILVDDHSSDHSAELAQKLTGNDKHIHHIRLPHEKQGKKAAIDAGIDLAKGELIVLTDADCSHEPLWLEFMSSYYYQQDVLLVSGPVKMIPGDGFFSKFQALEFMSLAGTGAASFMRGKPVMCSAANLAFRKELYLEARNELYQDFPSGDDMFLMLYLNRNYPGRAGFLKNRNALVSTCTGRDPASFFSQRIRWSSKSLLYRDLNLVYLSLLVFLLNLNLLLLLAFSFLHLQYFLVFLAVIALKAETDYSFLKTVARFSGQKKLLKIFLPSLIIYPFYIVFTAVAGFVSFFRKRKGN